MSDHDFYNDGHRALQDRFDSRRLADRLVERIVADEFSATDRLIVEGAPFFWLATADADGWPDVSYKGGRPGFVRVLDDDRTLAFPSYDGNGMYRSLGNIVANPKVALLFVDFERSRRLRVKGTAALHDDPALLAQWPGAELIVHVQATSVFPNCPRYLHQVSIGSLSEYAPAEDHVPPEPEWKQYPDFQPYLPRT